MLSGMVSAELEWAEGVYHLNDEALLAELSLLLTSVNDLGGAYAGCPFGGVLRVTAAGAEGGLVTYTLGLATDSCCVYEVDGRHYQYARNLWTPDDSPDNTSLLSLFGIDLSNWRN